MVEFDIVLTKDKIPIVYHDFVFCIDQLSSNADKKQQQQQQQQDENTNPTTNTNTKSQSNNNLLSLAVNMLTYDEVKQNRVSNYRNRKKSSIILVFTNDLFSLRYTRKRFSKSRRICPTSWKSSSPVKWCFPRLKKCALNSIPSSVSMSKSNTLSTWKYDFLLIKIPRFLDLN